MRRIVLGTRYSTESKVASFSITRCNSIVLWCSSWMMGIHVERVKTTVFMQMGFFAAFAGILSTLEVTYFWPSQGQGYLMPTLAAVFIGGTSVFGGMGTVYGSFIGAIIIGSLEPGIIAGLHLTGFYIQLIYGLIIMLSVSIYAILLRKRR